MAGSLQAAGKKKGGKGKAPSAAAAANGSGVADALAEGLEEVETAPDLDEGTAGKKKQ
jgi:hypothetical protein